MEENRMPTNANLSIQISELKKMMDEATLELKQTLLELNQAKESHNGYRDVQFAHIRNMLWNQNQSDPPFVSEPLPLVVNPDFVKMVAVKVDEENTEKDGKEDNIEDDVSAVVEEKFVGLPIMPSSVFVKAPFTLQYDFFIVDKIAECMKVCLPPSNYNVKTLEDFCTSGVCKNALVDISFQFAASLKLSYISYNFIGFQGADSKHIELDKPPPVPPEPEYRDDFDIVLWKAFVSSDLVELAYRSNYYPENCSVTLAEAVQHQFNSISATVGINFSTCPVTCQQHFCDKSRTTRYCISQPQSWKLELIYSIVGNSFMPYQIFQDALMQTVDNKTSKSKEELVEVIGIIVKARDNGFSLTERDRLWVRGLLPPCIISFEQQHAHFMDLYHSLEKNTINEPESVISLAKWRILNMLHDRNETLYYRVLLIISKALLPSSTL